MAMKNSMTLFITAALVILIVSYNNCAEKKLELNNSSLSIGGISTIAFDGDSLSVSGANLNDVTRVDLKGGDKTIPLYIQSKAENQLLAKSNSSLELASGLYHLVINRSGSETVIPMEVTVTSDSKFTPINPSEIGQVPLVGGTTKEFALPASIPTDAKEVLIYAWVKSGSVSPSAAFNYHIFTREGATQYGQYLYASTYQQNAISYNSDNFWLPVTSERIVGVTLAGTNGNFTAGGNLSGSIVVIGYR